ncbi:MAG: hypothetical protein L6R28_00610 [Planctomycetes bacterium]|nr:hypothetical protein [Planctomycetota bacterium]
MKTARRTLPVFALACLAWAGNFTLEGAENTAGLAQAAREAVAEDAAVAQAAVAKLRAAGPAGLEALFETHAKAIAADWGLPALPSVTKLAPPDQERSNAAGPGIKPNADPAATRLRLALDKVAQQKDAIASRLYWYTDFELAKAAAAAAHKPILSLRLLGKLDEDYSCANSRFFRTVLYANRDVSAYLRERYVLHWQSVRPVPKVTIDFGDGRVLERTLTGNSIHYVLDGHGRTIDAIPGLYSAARFKELLVRGEEAAKAVGSFKQDIFESRMRQWHASWGTENAAALKRERDQARASADGNAQTGRAGAGAHPTAREAAPFAESKMVAELPILRRMAADDPLLRPENELWQKTAHLHEDDARLDAGSLALMADKLPPAASAMPLAATKEAIESPLMRIARTFQASIAQDTVYNEYVFHRRIHEWFALDGAAAWKVGDLSEKVYAQLFLTPSSDPWLGLVPANTYTALPCDGLTTTSK